MQLLNRIILSLLCFFCVTESLSGLQLKQLTDNKNKPSSTAVVASTNPIPFLENIFITLDDIVSYKTSDPATNLSQRKHHEMLTQALRKLYLPDQEECSENLLKLRGILHTMLRRTSLLIDKIFLQKTPAHQAITTIFESARKKVNQLFIEQAEQNTLSDYGITPLHTESFFKALEAQTRHRIIDSIEKRQTKILVASGSTLGLGLLSYMGYRWHRKKTTAVVQTTPTPPVPQSNQNEIQRPPAINTDTHNNQKGDNPATGGAITESPRSSLPMYFDKLLSNEHLMNHGRDLLPAGMIALAVAPYVISNYAIPVGACAIYDITTLASKCVSYVKEKPAHGIFAAIGAGGMVYFFGNATLETIMSILYNTPYIPNPVNAAAMYYAAGKMTSFALSTEENPEDSSSLTKSITDGLTQLECYRKKAAQHVATHKGKYCAGGAGAAATAILYHQGILTTIPLYISGTMLTAFPQATLSLQVAAVGTITALQIAGPRTTKHALQKLVPFIKNKAHILENNTSKYLESANQLLKRFVNTEKPPTQTNETAEKPVEEQQVAPTVEETNRTATTESPQSSPTGFIGRLVTWGTSWVPSRETLGNISLGCNRRCRRQNNASTKEPQGESAPQQNAP